MTFKPFPFLLLVLCVFASTSYGQNFNKLATKAQKNGLYCEAAIYACKSLQLKPEKNKKAQKLLAECYLEAFRINQLHIRNLKSASLSFSGDKTVYAREAVVDKYDSLMILQTDYALIPPLGKSDKKLVLKFSPENLTPVHTEAQEKLKQAQEQAADMHYLEGEQLVQEEDLESNRAAAREFQQALNFVPNYKAAALKLKEAQKKGVKRIALVPFADKTYTSEYGDIGERIADLIRTRSQGNITHLVEFLPSQEVAHALQTRTWDINEMLTAENAAKLGKELGIHEVWIGQVTQLIVPKEDRVSNNRETLTRSVVVGEEKYTNKKGKVKTRNVYGDVTATVVKLTRLNDGTLNYSVQIVDVVQQHSEPLNTYKEEVGNSHTYYSFYSGDKRAFSGVNTTDQALPSFVDRTNTLIEAAAARLSEELRQREERIIIPLRVALSE